MWEDVLCAQSHSKHEQHSAAVPHCQPVHVSLWNLNRGTDSRGTKPNTICISSRLCGAEMPFSRSYHFLFFPSHQIFHLCASRSAAPAVRVSAESDRWQFLTTLFLRHALYKGFEEKMVFLWQQAEHTNSSNGHSSEAAIVPGWHIGSREKCYHSHHFRPQCWEHFEAVSSGQPVLSLPRRENTLLKQSVFFYDCTYSLFSEHVIICKSPRYISRFVLCDRFGPAALMCAVKVSKPWDAWRGPWQSSTVLCWVQAVPWRAEVQQQHQAAAPLQPGSVWLLCCTVGHHHPLPCTAEKETKGVRNK